MVNTVQENVDEIKTIKTFISQERKTVAVQGLGFVGSAMIAALSQARNEKNEILYNVLGVECLDENNGWKVESVNQGIPPISSMDSNITNAYTEAYQNKNLMATCSEYAYAIADIVVVDVNLDIVKEERGNPSQYQFSYDAFKKAIGTVAHNIREHTVVVVETTVPPGTTEKIIYPIFQDVFQQRNLDCDKVYLCYSYERVMPGEQYLNSIINFYRVYAGFNDVSAVKGREFFETFINTHDYPLSRMSSTTTAEMAKILENSYRAVNIAFIQEWTESAHAAGVNLFEAIEAIRVRPTHKNIMAPGFGVGGYCLPKDPLFADWAFNNLFTGTSKFDMSLRAVAINDMMPAYTLQLLKEVVPSLHGRQVTILGISYLHDVADTRFSPSEYFYDQCVAEGAGIVLHDPFVNHWNEKDMEVDTDINSLKRVHHDIALFTMRHNDYVTLDSDGILSLLPGVQVVIDANNIITDDVARELSRKGITMIGVGKGHWRNFITQGEGRG